MATNLILTIDIGGTGLKAAIVDARGALLTERLRVETPQPCPPPAMLTALAELVRPLPEARFVAVGFPGVVRRGRVLTAPNLGSEDWHGFALERALAKRLGKPVRIANDADLQGLGAVRGRGVEILITLGTGLGFALFADGVLAPHLELSHHPFRKGETYDLQLGNRALEKIGKKKWNRRVRLAIDTIRRLSSFDHLYIGGGNAKKIDFDLERDVSLVSSTIALRGGARLWTDALGDGEETA